MMMTVVLTEDGVVALIKVLIVFQSVDAAQDLQETAGVVNSCIAFAVTFLRHCLLMIQIITKLNKDKVMFSKCPAWESGRCKKATQGPAQKSVPSKEPTKGPARETDPCKKATQEPALESVPCKKAAQ